MPGCVAQGANHAKPSPDAPLPVLMPVALRLVGAFLAHTAEGTETSAAGLSVLRLLAARDGLKSGEVAARGWWTPGTVTAVVDTLVRDGYVQRRRGEQDRRVVRLHLTAAGRRKVTEAVSVMGPKWQDAFSYVDPAGRPPPDNCGMTEDSAGPVAGPLADLSRALAATDRIVTGIGGSQWRAETPCAGLDVRAVLNHLVTGNLVFAARVGGGQAPGPDADLLGDDPLAAFRSAGEALERAFAAPDVLTAAYAAPWGGTAPGVALVHVRVTEVLVHGWDLARATGQPADFPADVAERALAGVRQQLTSRPAGPDTPFAPEVPVAADAPAIDRLAGFLGRAWPPGPA